MNKKSIIIGIIALAVIVGLGFLFEGDNFFKAKRETQPADRPMGFTDREATVYVDYTDAGFSPAVIRIDVDDAVVFTNGSAHPMWVASDPHPVHSAYPQFNAKKGYAPGESYVFPFRQAGSWTYHNHLQPADTGKVVVEP
ncbi:MAG: hypothetical protein HY398_01335 [Candidatus Doudnabacteria bacterium]|nr:hypothetical protein [Candidatus Doudnabacteria bacterium]